MTAPARRELVEALRRRYAAATREEKVNLLTEFAAVSGLHRESAIRVLNEEAEPEPPIKRAGRPRCRRTAAIPFQHSGMKDQPTSGSQYLDTGNSF